MALINEYKRKMVVDMWKEGKSQAAISRELKISRCAVQNIILKFRLYSTIQDLPRSGRPLKTSRSEVRALIIMSKRHPMWPASRLCREWKTENSVSVGTVKHLLNKHGLFGRVAAKKPKLTICQKKKRLSFCRNYYNWTRNMWQNVIYSDESRIELHPSVRVFVRRPINQRFSQRYTIKTVRKGGKSIIVWGAIKANGGRKLIRCQGNVNSLEYQRILCEGLLPMIGPNEIFQHDGAAPHQSICTKNFLDSAGVCVINDWPPVSPDINIIEHLWHEMKRKVALRKPKTLDELWFVCQEEWNSISCDTISKLYDSIQTRLHAIICNHGAATKY